MISRWRYALKVILFGNGHVFCQARQDFVSITVSIAREVEIIEKDRDVFIESIIRVFRQSEKEFYSKAAAALCHNNVKDSTSTPSYSPPPLMPSNSGISKTHNNSAVSTPADSESSLSTDFNCLSSVGSNSRKGSNNYPLVRHEQRHMLPLPTVTGESYLDGNNTPSNLVVAAYPPSTMENEDFSSNSLYIHEIDLE